MATEKFDRIVLDESRPDGEYAHNDYPKIFALRQAPQKIVIGDHLGGFDESYRNHLFNHLASIAEDTCEVWTNYIIPQEVQANYPQLTFKMNLPLWNLRAYEGYNMHPPLDYKNFICSFNGTSHVGRKLLVAILHNQGWFNTDYCTKNFTFTNDTINGHVRDFVGDREKFYGKFFTCDPEFAETLYTIDYQRFNLRHCVDTLENQLTQSFLHIPSESLSTSHVPFVTEKFMLSVVTRGLFLSHAQFNWNSLLEKVYGFRLYNNIFDYRFDTIPNPVERVVELVSMISKFSKLSALDWHDLYSLEQDNIEYNYDHYFSGDWIRAVKKHHD